ncbi:thiamine-phosphate kinase [Xanthobacteraceae bacterium Astr-EGSB]|uniref:thiamine-phosphate kinase n=1 Tax=Astrobacterium formosum TaxID=3069710 RepID=UPI0027B2C9CB|nr:thiamine-phosphate kinase [Xanthobacteraceae bacterium Astr-EGSB]
MSVADAEDSPEDRMIARHFKPLATAPGAFGLVDDAAVITPPAGHDLVLKADAIVGGTHFFPDDPPGAIARKALRVNLSDLAAKGATPLGHLLSLALPAGIDDDWLAQFAAGLGDDAERHGCPLYGGDTVRSPGPVMVAVSVFGAVPHGRMLMRAGARAGDLVVVTGTIGDAALGLRLRQDADAGRSWRLTAEERAHLLDRYLLPRPRNAVALALREHAAGGMDVSDGLAGDLGKMCRASGVTAEVDVAAVPLSAAARKAIAADSGLVEPALTGGDDFEVLASVAEAQWEPLLQAAQAVGVQVAIIGRFRAAGEEGPQALFMSERRRMSFARPSYSHF